MADPRVVQWAPAVPARVAHAGERRGCARDPVQVGRDRELTEEPGAASRSSGTVPARPGYEVTEPVTVLVPAHNERQESRRRCTRCSPPPTRDLQIVVIDDGSTDRTAEIAAGDPRPEGDGGAAAQLRQARGAQHRSELRASRHRGDDRRGYRLRAGCPVPAPPAAGRSGGRRGVSGNTKVGNRRRLLGRWQHLEISSGSTWTGGCSRCWSACRRFRYHEGFIRRDARLSMGGGQRRHARRGHRHHDGSLAGGSDRVVYEETAIAWTGVPALFDQL